MSRILITGSSKGLGASLALIFAKNKYDVILHGRDEASLKKIESEVLAHNVKSHIIIGDIINSDTINDIKSVSEEKGIDILINNAGIYLNQPFLETSMNDFRKVIETNFMSVVLVTHTLFPILKSKESGLIININSLAGKNGSDGEAAYCASKHALRGFSSAIQYDATRYGIRVIDIFFGALQTEMTKDRENQEKLISTKDAAKSIFMLSNSYKTMRITEINFNRMIY